MSALFGEVRAVYFDLDDTLCGYWDACKIGLRKVFDIHGRVGLSSEEMIRHWAAAFRGFVPDIKTERWYEIYCETGEPTRTEQMRLTLERVGVTDPDHAARLSQAYMELRNEHLALFDDALLVLDTLKGRYPLGLITNGPADIQRMEIAKLGIGHYFDHFFIEGELGFGKPEQRVFSQAAAAVGFGPSQLLFVGNSYRHDLEPAILAGWRTAWVRRPSDVAPSAGPEPTLPEERPEGHPAPDVEIRELRELLPLLGLG